MTPNKKKEGLARLFQIAGERKGLLILSGILSAISALCMLVPYWSIYEILNELLSKAGNLGSIDSDLLIYWGWIAFGGLIIGLILLYASLMASHVAAFRILWTACKTIRTYREIIPGISQRYLHRCYQKDNRTKYRENRILHSPYDSRHGKRRGNRNFHVCYFLFTQRLVSCNLSCLYRIKHWITIHQLHGQNCKNIYRQLF